MKALRDFFEAMAKRLRNEYGQTLIEYILVIVLISIALIGAFYLSGVQGGVTTSSQNIGDYLTGTQTPTYPQ